MKVKFGVEEGTVRVILNMIVTILGPYRPQRVKEKGFLKKGKEKEGFKVCKTTQKQIQSTIFASRHSAVNK